MIIRQLSVFIENKTGRINEVSRLLGSNGINMTAFSLAESVDFGILRLIVSDVDLAVRVLKQANFGVSVTEVLGFSCPNVPGSLAAVLECLAKESIFIEYMYAFSEGNCANIIIRPNNIEQCAKVLDCNCADLNLEKVATDCCK